MDVITLLAAIGGGAFGAIIGALPSFIMTGFIVIAGVAVAMSGGPDVLIGNVAFGPYFGPHISFAGAVAATVFAANKAKKLDAGANILPSLAQFGNWQIILVGGVFGGLGYLVHYLYSSVLKIPTDTVALTVFTLGVLARIAFGNTKVTGNYDKPEKRKFISTGNDLVFVLVLGASIGLLTGGVGSMMAKAGLDISLFHVLAFGIAAVTLIFTQTGFGCPGTHHIAITSALACVVTQGQILPAVITGAVAALMGDFAQKTFNDYGDSHIDAPAFTIMILTAVLLAIK